MNKDVIYIDVEDDITAIIGKVKEANEKIVALVPPKRIGVLQSSVNLRLLSRAAEQSDKRLVLITNNAALSALASAAKVPVAKNLQSKPELAPIAALDVDNGEDIIDGSQLPVGELARTADGPSKATTAFGSVAIDDAITQNAAEEPTKATPPMPGATPQKPRVKSGIKVPNFASFRKKLVLIIAAAVLFVGFLVWAIFFAPSATVVITARTTESSANAKVTLASTANTDMAANTLKSVTEELKKDLSVEFEATGKKDVGEKAQGQVIFKNCESMSAQTVPAGTAITSNGKTFTTQSAVSVPAGSGGFGGCSSPGTSGAVGVTAQDIGEQYNVANGTTFSVAGHSSSSGSVYFNAVASTDMSGGSKKQVKVVSDDDIQKAGEEFARQNSDDAKKQLTSEFDDTFTILDQSFKTAQGNPQSTPASGQEVSSGKAKLTATVTYSLSAVTKADVAKFLGDYFDQQLKDTQDQRVYDNGSGGATFTSVTVNNNGITANLVATAKIGPKIEDSTIKDGAKGKRYGEIQSAIEAIQGVDDVDVKFWPFWVSSAPNDTNRIKVEFNLNDAS